MKAFRYLTLVTVLVTSVGAWSMMEAQQAPAPAPGQPAQAAPQAPPADRTFEGQLSKIDTNTRQIILTATGNKQMTFTYTDKTQMVGVENNNVQGLAGKTGSNLKITYREDRGTNQASKIEVVPPPKQ